MVDPDPQAVQQQRGQDRAEEQGVGQIKMAPRQEAQGPQEFTVEALAPAALLPHPLAQGAGATSGTGRLVDEVGLVSLFQHQIGQVAVVPEDAFPAQEGLGEVPVLDRGDEGTPVGGQDPAAAGHHPKEALRRAFLMERGPVAQVDQPGQQVGAGSHAHGPGGGADRGVPERGHQMAQGVGGQPGIAVDGDDIFPGGPLKGGPLRLAFAPVFRQGEDLQRPVRGIPLRELGPPAAVRRVTTVVDHEDFQGARISLVPEAGYAFLQHFPRFVKGGDDEGDPGSRARRVLRPALAAVFCMGQQHLGQQVG